jgi:hypothetical protein
MASKILLGLAALALVLQGVLAWVLVRYLTGEPRPDLINPFRWGGAAISGSFAAGLAALIGGLILSRQPGTRLPMALGLAAVSLSVFEGLFFGFIYLIGAGQPR